MERMLHIVRNALIQMLGGWTEEEVRNAFIIARNEFNRRERGIREVEILGGRGAILLPASSLQVADEARPQCLLAKIAGPTIGAQLDIQRECVTSPDAEQELQREEQVLDLVS